MNYVLGNWLKLDSENSLSSYDNLGYEYDLDTNNFKEPKKDERYNEDENIEDINYYKKKFKELNEINSDLKDQINMLNATNLKKNNELSTDLIFQLQRNDMNNLIIRSLNFSNFGLKIFGGASLLLNFYLIYKRK